MKVLRALGLVFFLILGIRAAQGQNTLPAVNLKTLDGKNTDLVSFAGNGKITVICVWLSWATPSTRQLDAITPVYADWQKKYNAELIAVSSDASSQLEKIKGMVEKNNWPFTILLDSENQLRNRLGVDLYPKTFIVNTRGEIIYTHSGFSSGDEVELEEQLKLLRGQ